MSHHGGGHGHKGHAAHGHGSHHHFIGGFALGGLYILIGLFLSLVGVAVLTLTLVFMGFHPWLFPVVFAPPVAWVVHHDRKVHQRNALRARERARVQEYNRQEREKFLRNIEDAKHGRRSW